jgi:pimeloyl-ACP methyl ester carboxylesterase
VVAAFIRELGLEHASIVGHSMGGGAAVVLAATRPELVEKLVLVNAVCYPFPMPLVGRIVLLPLLGRFIFTRVYGKKEFDLHTRGEFNGEEPVSDEFVDTLYAQFDTPAARRASHRSVVTLSRAGRISAYVPRVTAPTHIVWGSDDKSFTPEVARRLNSEIPGSTLELVESAGHALPLERPGAFCDAVMPFLTKRG